MHLLHGHALAVPAAPGASGQSDGAHLPFHGLHLQPSGLGHTGAGRQVGSAVVAALGPGGGHYRCSAVHLPCSAPPELPRLGPSGPGKGQE
eukprot:7006836-Lingulodinium_polyedra.AAC.1